MNPLYVSVTVLVLLIPGSRMYSPSVAISAIGQSQCRQAGGGGGAVGVGLSPGGGALGCLLIGHSYARPGPNRSGWLGVTPRRAQRAGRSRRPARRCAAP